LDRVLEAEMLKETFARPAGLDSPGAVLSAVANTPGDRWLVEVLLGRSLGTWSSSDRG
jgi:hypothetical protein